METIKFHLPGFLYLDCHNLINLIDYGCFSSFISISLHIGTLIRTAIDPYSSTPSRYYPGVDLINFGEQGVSILEHFHSNGNWIDAAFDFLQLEKLGIEHKFIVAKDQGHGWDEPLENELSEILQNVESGLLKVLRRR